MPNWCEGNIRFRGKQKDIKRFLKSEIVDCHYSKEVGNDEEEPVIEDKDYYLIIKTKGEGHWLYIRNTARNFLPDYNEIYLDEESDEKETIICIDGFKAAWSFERCDAWKEFAKQYSMDVRMTGYDCGMLFSQVKTIYRDGKIKDVVHEYENGDDWYWNCPMPNNGG